MWCASRLYGAIYAMESANAQENRSLRTMLTCEMEMQWSSCLLDGTLTDLSHPAACCPKSILRKRISCC
jgi:hypothetical protein